MRALVTGGAGFIGSHVADALVAAGHDTCVLDDLSTGYRENVPPTADLVVGDVADPVAVRQAVEGAEVVFHVAARRAVLASVSDPLGTDLTNTHGTLTVLEASREAGVRRVVSASSSSVYGGAARLPTPESDPTLPRSPYAVTKLAGEHYCRVFSELFGLETVSLRYFNVYGPRQRPDSAYAAVVPLFLEAVRAGTSPTIHGDGRQSRAFCYIDDVVAANLAAATAPAATCTGRAYNVGGDRRVDLLELLETMGEVLRATPRPVHTEVRAGDIRHSEADLSAVGRDLGWKPQVELADGLRRTTTWFAARP